MNSSGPERTTPEEVEAWARSMAKARQEIGGAIGEANARARGEAAKAASEAEYHQWVKNTRYMRVLKP